jgi:hypothetical protein
MASRGLVTVFEYWNHVVLADKLLLSISSPIEDREGEESWEDISSQDSTVR